MTVINPRVLFNSYIHTGYPVPGETTIYDTTQKIDLDMALDGGVLIKVLVLSVDPYQRGRMRPPNPSTGKQGYTTSFTIGSPLDNYGVGIILRSENSEIKQGDHVYGRLEYQGYIVRPNISGLKVLENKEGLPWSAYLGVAGMPGQTAYVGWKLFSKAKTGETVFVTTAGGPVGSAVVQIAKSDGLKVIASAGSDEKVAFAKELGADIAFNYKTKNTKDALEELGHGIDIFWDNVGGETLDTALEALNDFGRVIACGGISGYNAAEPYGVKNTMQIVTKRLSLNGFVVTDHPDLIQEFNRVFPEKIASGDIKHREHVYPGLDHAGQAMLDVQKGDNKAKAVIVMPNA